MKKLPVILLGLASLCFVNTSMAQNPNVLITDADFTGSNSCDCVNDFVNGSLAHFFDSGNGGNYSDNEDETIVFCPDLLTGTKVSVAFGINAGFSWSVDASDSVYVYDGNSTAAPLLGVHNSITDPTGFTHQASWNNPSGCLTVRFVSDGSVTAAGWGANVTCGNVPQPYEPHIYGYINGGSYPDSTLQDMSPADTGYVDVCFGDSVLLSASGTFAFSSENNNGQGYSQNINNCTYEWDFSNGTSQTGKDVWFTPPARSGYLVTLRMTDPIGWIQVIQCKIRVSTVPSFATTIAYPDTICLGATSDLSGGVTNTDTVGVAPTDGSFEIGGTFAGLTYLPDGSGQNYQTSIPISGFGPTQTIQNITDITQMCITMEHSFLGDLEMLLECPNGTQGTIFNSYGGGIGIIPGGFNGGGTYLGDALDNNIGNPGVGWEYCFDSNSPTFGTMAVEFAAGNTVPTTITPGQAMNPNGIYEPEDPWTAFIGCPINGSWTITVRDNLSIDDGYIFEWGIFFDPAINPNTETYTPQITSEMWLPDPTIVVDSDTLIQVQPGGTGNFGYTFQVTDNFGCTYDTTIQVNVLPLPSISASPFACDLEYQFAGNVTPNPGTWSAAGVGHGGTMAFNPNNAATNPFVTVSSHGTYDVTFTDNVCNLDTTIQVLFLPDPQVFLSDYTFCEGETQVLDAQNATSNASFLWSNGATSQTIEVGSSGTYDVAVTTFCGTANATSIIIVEPCNIIIPNVFSPNGDGYNDNFVITGLDRHPDSHIMIYNRWGKLIYEDENYQNDWNGKIGSTFAADGTYYYILIRGDGEEYTGDISLLRGK